jgi:hypothetical protein
MSSALYVGVDLTAQMVEQMGSPRRSKTLDKDQVTRKYTTRIGAVEGLIPALGTASPEYPDHYLTSWEYARTGEGELTEVTLIYETNDSGAILNPLAPLPPDEVEYIAATTERHLGAHPSYDPDWLGNPETNNVADPRGQPTTEPTKPGVESYLIPTGVYRKVTYSHDAPALSAQSMGTRNIPAGEAGANQWLKTGYTLRITKGVYQLSQEWMFLPIGTWDTDIYGAS